MIIENEEKSKKIKAMPILVVSLSLLFILILIVGFFLFFYNNSSESSHLPDSIQKSPEYMSLYEIDEKVEYLDLLIHVSDTVAFSELSDISEPSEILIEEKFNVSLRDELRNKDTYRKEIGFSLDRKYKSYYFEDKEILIEDYLYRNVLQMKLESEYREAVIVWHNMSLIAWFNLSDFIGDSLVDDVKFYDVNNDYNLLNKSYVFKYQEKQNVSNCDEFRKCKIIEDNVWVEFDSLSKLPKKDIKIGLFIDLKEGEIIEWVIEKDGFEIMEWAVVEGTNAGFVVTAPSTDPSDTNGAMSSHVIATKASSPADATHVSEIGIWMDTASTEANFEVGIYTHDAGNDRPNAVVGSLYQSNAKGTNAGWKTVAVDIDISPSTVYWIAMQLDTTTPATSGNYANDIGGRYSYHLNTATLPDPWGVSDGSSNNIFEAYYAVWDTGTDTAPTTTINQPLNQSYTATNMTFNITATDDNYVDNCTVSFNGGNTNFTLMNTTTTPTQFTWTNTTLAQGSINSTFYCNDSIGNITEKSRTFFVDSIAPVFPAATGIPPNKTLVWETSLLTDFNATDTNGITSWRVNNSVEFEINSTGGLTNKTNLAAKQYILNISANDTYNNINSTLWNVTMEVGADTTIPTISINNPLNQSYNVTTLIFNVTSTDNIQLENCTVSWNGGTNNYTLMNTTTSPTQWTFTNASVGQGSHNATYYCNDTSGNVNNASVMYFIDSIAPTFAGGFAPNRTQAFELELITDFNATDMGVGGITYRLHNWTNIFAINATGGLNNITGISAGTYVLNISTNDSLMNMESKLWKLIVNQASPSGSLTFDPIGAEEYTYESTVTGTENNPHDADVSYILERYNSFIPAWEQPSNPDVEVLGADTWTYYWNTTGGQNYTANANMDNGAVTILQNSSLVIGLTVTNPLTYPAPTDFSGTDCPTELTCTLNITNGIFRVGTRYAKYSTAGNNNYSATSGINSTIINQGTSEIAVYINASRSPFNTTETVAQDTWINVSNVSGSGTLQLYINGVLNNSNASSMLEYRVNFTEGNWNVTGKIVPPTPANWTTDYESWDVNITADADTTKPVFTVIPNNATLEYKVDELGVDFNATDETGFDTYSINWTTNFSINDSGWLSNTTVIPIGIFYINVTINDTSNNLNSTIWNVTVNDTLPPTIDAPPNRTQNEGLSLVTDFNATDLGVGVDTWAINWTTNFSINNTGGLVNSSVMPIGIFYINVSVNDTMNHLASVIWWINVQAPVTAGNPCGLIDVYYNNPYLPKVYRRRCDIEA